MERSLVWCALGVGLLGTLCSLLLSWSKERETSRATLPYPILSALIPLMVFMATLPGKPPFAEGQALGRGFLAGGMGALLASWLTLRALTGRETGAPRSFSAAVAGPQFLALCLAAVPLLTLRQSLLDALLGVAIGWFTVAFLQIVGSHQKNSLPYTALCLTTTTGFLLTLCAAEALGELLKSVRFAASPYPVAWSALTLAFAISVPLLLFVCGLRPGGLALLPRLIGRIVLGGGALLIVAKVFGSRLLLPMPLLGMVAGGVGAALLAWWLLATTEVPADKEDFVDRGAWQSGALPVLVFSAAIMVAFQEMPGIGLTFVLLGGWFVVGLALIGALERGSQTSLQTNADAAVNVRLEGQGNDGNTPWRMDGTAVSLIKLLLFGVILLFYALFTKRFAPDLKGVSLTNHYALFGFLIGAFSPGSLAQFLSRRLLMTPPGSLLIRIVLIGALILLLPAALLALFGAKCALALYFGLALAVVLTSHSEDAPLDQTLLPALCALAIALALAQWTHHVLPFAVLSRKLKAKLLLEAFAALIALIVLSEVGQRLMGRSLQATLESTLEGEAKS